MTDERTLYIGTDHALYRARPGSDGRWRAEGVALAGMGGVRGLVIDPDEPRRWWACTAGHGVLVTEDEGIAWRPRGAGLGGAEGWCLARHPRTGDLWYGAGPAAISRSADGGESWSKCGGPVEDDAAERPEWEAHRPAQPGHVRQITFGEAGLVLAAVEEGWLLRSDDGGRTWAVVRDGLDRDCHAVSLVPGDVDTVIVTTGTGVYRSEDHGRTFAHSDDGLRHRSVTQVVLHPDRPEVLFTAAADCDPELAVQRPEGASGGFYRSDDGGRTWWRLTGGVPETLRPAPMCVAGDAGDPDAFYVGMTDGSVWLTEDGGETFAIAVEGIRGWVRHMVVRRR